MSWITNRNVRCTIFVKTKNGYCHRYDNQSETNPGDKSKPALKLKRAERNICLVKSNNGKKCKEKVFPPKQYCSKHEIHGSGDPYVNIQLPTDSEFSEENYKVEERQGTGYDYGREDF